MKAADNKEPKMIIEELYKIYGPNQQQALDMLQSGSSKEQIKDKLGSTVGVADASLQLYPGELFIVMGLSGSGKSTLIRCVNRLLEPTSGDIYIDEENVVNMSAEQLRQLRRKRLGMVFQQFSLFPHRTVLDNVAYGLEVQGIPREKRYEQAREVLKMVGLDGWGSSYPGSLSGGMQQRVGLARALVHDPEILLMDEPFSALDPLIRREMQNELLQLQQELEKTILFITHDLDEAMRLGDRIAIMNEGWIVQSGTPQEILRNPANDYVRAFLEDVDRFKVLSAADVMVQPEPILHPDDPPQKALRQMEQSGTWYAPVVDPDRRIVAMVSSEDAASAAADATGKIAEVMHQNVHKSSGDIVLQNIVPVIAQNEYPVAVVDEQDQLQGMVDALSLLSGFLEKDSEENTVKQSAGGR